MTLQNRINELFNKFNLSLSTVEKTELMAEATLENGTIIFTDAEGFEDGAEVYIVNEEGEKIPLPDGDYTLEDGRTLTIADSGKIAKSEGKGKAEGEGKKAEGNAPKTSNLPKQLRHLQLRSRLLKEQQSQSRTNSLLRTKSSKRRRK